MVDQPFKFEKYFFPIINIVANQNHKPTEPKDVMFDVSSNLMTPKETQRIYQLNINIHVVEEESTNFPYTGGLQVVGLFSVNDSIDKEEIEALISSKGAGILYSAAREFLLTVTGRGPWAPLSLPYVHDLRETLIEEVDADTIIE